MLLSPGCSGAFYMKIVGIVESVVANLSDMDQFFLTTDAYHLQKRKSNYYYYYLNKNINSGLNCQPSTKATTQ